MCKERIQEKFAKIEDARHEEVEIMRENAESIGEIIAVDSKAIRSTGKKGRAHSFLQILRHIQRKVV